jgi:GAF domain-containing protein
MGANQEFGAERRHHVRQVVHAPAFASFDGVTGGMILDLSEQGLSMQTGYGLDMNVLERKAPDKNQPVRVKVDLSDPAVHMETTGYIAWADALGRAGVRFSDLPEDARRRLKEWLALNAGAPSYTAPVVNVGSAWGWGTRKPGLTESDRIAISLEVDPNANGNGTKGNGKWHPASGTVQFEFSSLGSDLAAALRLIAERARSLTRAGAAAIALIHKGAITCRATVGNGAPPLGTQLNVNSGISGECVREGKALRCDDAEYDPRVDLESCRSLGVRSILAAPIRFELDTLGLLMVFAPEPFNFDEGDIVVAESLAHTVVRTLRQSEGPQHY